MMGGGRGGTERRTGFYIHVQEAFDGAFEVPFSRCGVCKKERRRKRKRKEKKEGL